MVNNWEQTEIIKDIFCPFEKKRNLNKKINNQCYVHTIQKFWDHFKLIRNPSRTTI